MNAENSGILLKKWKIIKKSTKLYKILPFLDKFNPYKDLRIDDETGHVYDSAFIQNYRSMVIWIIDIHLNGLIANFLLAVYLFQPLHYFLVLANGLTIWIVLKIWSLLWDNIFDGLVRVARNLPKK